MKSKGGKLVTCKDGGEVSANTTKKMSLLRMVEDGMINFMFVDFALRVMDKQKLPLVILELLLQLKI